VRAAGKIQARFVSNAILEAGGEIIIENEVGNSRITTGGKFTSKGGAILSSHITACGDIRCHTVGSEAGIRAILELSLAPEALKQIQVSLAQAQALANAAQSARAAVEPLKRIMKQLNAQQREKATDLMYQADDADQQAKEVLASLSGPRQQLSTAMASAIHVDGMLYGELVVRCLGYEATIRETHRGPLKIQFRGGKTDPHFAMLDSQGQPIKNFPASASSDAVWKLIQPETLK